MLHNARYHLTTAAFLVGSVSIYGLFFVLPAFVGFGYSFTSWNGINATARFVGLSNYIEAMTDARFWNAVWNTVKLTLIQSAFFNFGILVICAVIERSTTRWVRAVVRGLLFVPYIVSFVVVSSVWSFMLSFRVGAVNALLRAAGLSSLAMDWLGSQNMALSLRLLRLHRRARVRLVDFAGQADGEVLALHVQRDDCAAWHAIMREIDRARQLQPDLHVPSLPSFSTSLHSMSYSASGTISSAQSRGMWSANRSSLPSRR